MIDWAKEIEDDLNWREKELHSFKLAVSFAEKDSIRKTALLRAMLALLYAHYEGFCKFVWDLYLDAIEGDAPVRQDCRECIACFSLERRFRQLKGDLSPLSIWSFCNSEFLRLLSEPVSFASKLETDSNLWPHTYCSNAQKVGLPDAMMREHWTRMRSLVARRNDIAHGQKVLVKNLEEYRGYENVALLVMHELAVSVLEAIESKRYLAES